MKALSRALLAGLLGIGFAIQASGQEAKHGPPPSSLARRAAASAEAPKVLTGKERLGPKWTDEQRIDNCNVPPDKRGPKPRPSACTQASF
ncbi:hypothetical protein [Bradyrhizobium sp. Tv2a-2]|uniref:hypothetical protein n=1 Tax=Bradyrhizobium sp. Tv2a-2 TaxID=113395 RepID=UPI000414B363|nr:hypothetical protein [Bradyrhizobium sp. Tv2a-2]